MDDRHSILGEDYAVVFKFSRQLQDGGSYWNLDFMINQPVTPTQGYSTPLCLPI